jgi:HK97 family phage major capsid protein
VRRGGAGKVTYPPRSLFRKHAATVGEGAAKLEQCFDVELAKAAAKKIEGRTKMSFWSTPPAAEANINTRLGFTVQKSQNDQLLNADGTGTNTLGFLNAPDLQSQAISLIETNTDFFATGIVVNPTDWTTIELLKDDNGRYLVGQLTVPDEFGRLRTAPALWGRPIAVSKSLAQGSVLVGAFATASQLFRRMGLLIEATNTDQDDFIKNLVTIRAELRAALAIYAGAAFCEVTGSAPNEIHPGNGVRSGRS